MLKWSTWLLPEAVAVVVRITELAAAPVDTGLQFRESFLVGTSQPNLNLQYLAIHIPWWSVLEVWEDRHLL
jgi:hypothetical protein